MGKVRGKARRADPKDLGDTVADRFGVGEVHGIARFRCAKEIYRRDIIFHVPRINLPTQKSLEFMRSPPRGERRH